MWAAQGLDNVRVRLTLANPRHRLLLLKGRLEKSRARPPNLAHLLQFAPRKSRKDPECLPKVKTPTVKLSENAV